MVRCGRLDQVAGTGVGRTFRWLMWNMDDIPAFRYHGAPLGPGMIEPSDGVCASCGHSRGFGYSGSIYGDNPDELGDICPWCIADGSAAYKLRISFNHEHHLPDKVQLPEAVTDELFHRTPGFPSWQDRIWVCHCNDACRFLGDLSVEEARGPDWNAVERLMKTYGTRTFEPSRWLELAQHYQVADPSIFKFVCCHCNAVFYQIDAP